MIVVHCPDSCRNEARWIVSVILGEFLGIPHQLHFDSERTVRLSAGEKTLEMPAIFFERAQSSWLGRDTLPQQPLTSWSTADHLIRLHEGQRPVPVLWGTPRLDQLDDKVVLGIDIFGACFFMLSRYEEAVAGDLDRHGRFPHVASLAYRAGFLDRPIVDEYTEILWRAMTLLWPGMQRRAREFKMLVTCDVDHPYHASARSVPRLLKRTAGEALRKRRWRETVRPVKNFICSRRGNWSHDPYYHTVDWMMNINEAAGNRVSFFFIPEITDAFLDDTCPIADPAVGDMLARIAQRGHEIGIHPGYNTYHSPERLQSGLQVLREVLDRMHIRQQICGGRQHYLRWSTRTPAYWDGAGLTYDSTLGYAEHSGFRCGTCHEYRMYDLHWRRPLALRQRPLLCMESSVIQYMGYGLTEAALRRMKALKKAAREFAGNFVLLWHNSYLESHEAREIYRELIS